ncbi:ATP-binding protein [Streptomyces sp. NPDC088341]|uniref:ATP-binding protein n=1 Tax=Streptomyces sp. NPDC088341 TaxID=3154870 RepID=UPI003431D5CA
MLPTAQSGAQVALSPVEIEQWPRTVAARYLTCAWPKGQPASFRVPALERAVPVCRDMARVWMDSEGITDDDARRTALLVVSELMTNAIIHTNSSSIYGRLRQAGGRLIVEVQDEGRASAVSRAGHAEYAEYGRGLALVVRSVQALGTQVEADGSRTVWAWVPMPR